MSNIRQRVGFDEPYWRINREERNYAALLYYALLSGDNTPRFLDFIGCEFPYERDQLAAYVEYAYLRDLWDHSRTSNEDRRQIITELLGTADVQALGNTSVLEWNLHFGVSTPVASSSLIQSPARWSVKKFNPHISDDGDFLATCKFKWSFNIKPDLVIHTDNDHAVVIEAKYHSGEGSYPANGEEKAMFRGRDLPQVGQTELQKYMFEQLLGIDAMYLFVVQDANAKSDSHRTLVWNDIFQQLDITQAPPFVRRWLHELA